MTSSLTKNHLRSLYRARGSATGRISFHIVQSGGTSLRDRLATSTDGRRNIASLPASASGTGSASVYTYGSENMLTAAGATTLSFGDDQAPGRGCKPTHKPRSEG